MKSYFIFASDERSYLDLINIVRELKKRGLPYYFLFTKSQERLIPTHFINEYNYDTNIKSNQSHFYQTLSIDLPFKPDYVIISNENWEPEKTIAYEFKTKGSFVAGVETSSYTFTDLKTKLEIASRKSFPTNCVDVFFDNCDWSKQTKEISGWYKNKSVVVGNPKYDDIIVKDIPEENIIIIFGAKLDKAHYLLMDRINNEIIPQFKGYKIYYKPHPCEMREFSSSFEANKIKNTDIKVITNHDEFILLLNKSKYVISYFTSLLYYPLIFDKKIIIFDNILKNISINSLTSDFNETDFNFWKQILKFNTFEDFQHFFTNKFVETINKRNKKINNDLKKYLIPYSTSIDLDISSNNKSILKYFDKFGDQKSSSRIVDYLENNLVL